MWLRVVWYKFTAISKNITQGVNIPEDCNVQGHCNENLKYGRLKALFHPTAKYCIQKNLVSGLYKIKPYNTSSGIPQREPWHTHTHTHTCALLANATHHSELAQSNHYYLQINFSLQTQTTNRLLIPTTHIAYTVRVCAFGRICHLSLLSCIGVQVVSCNPIASCRWTTCSCSHLVTKSNGRQVGFVQNTNYRVRL
jgi:hypothetical protein